MLLHLNSQPTAPRRVVVLGAGGFVGGAAVRRFMANGTEILSLARADIDLLSDGVGPALAGKLRPTDALVVVSARAPCKDVPMLMDNLRMMQAVCAAIDASPVDHVVYISSDAVYADSPAPLTEDSCAEPGSMHGMMHLARELMLRETVKETPFTVLRPTLIYGADDPHNGYGPNRFRRLGATGEEIVLFGEGEERRDHVLVDDVAEIIELAVTHKSTGVLNVVTGEVASFRDIAHMVVKHFEAPVEIKGSPRTGEMPHNGYRPFDAAATRAAFPEFSYTALPDGLAQVHRATVGRV